MRSFLGRWASISSWTQVFAGDRQAAGSTTCAEQLTQYLSQFPCLRSLRLAGPGSDPDDVGRFAAGYGRYVVSHQVTWETLVSYEPALAVTHYLGACGEGAGIGAFICNHFLWNSRILSPLVTRRWTS